MTGPSWPGWLLLNSGLLLAVLATAVSVVDVSHRCRALYTQLQQMEATQWDSREQWGRLLLERSTLAAHHRVEQLAGEQLQMHWPTAAELQVIAP